jgi:hypothetical protein
MYRIELSPGEETAFRSIEELAVAIRRGIVTPRARIWHNASAKWLPIQFHPHYKAAAAMQLSSADLVAGAPVKPLELLTLGELMDPPAPPVPPRPAAPAKPAASHRASGPTSVPAYLPPLERRSPEPEPKPRKKAAAKSRRGKSGRRGLRVVLVGALLIGGSHLAISMASALGSEDLAALTRSHRRLVSAPANSAQQGRPETTAAAVLPGLPSVPRADFGRALAPRLTHTEAATPPLDAFRRDSESVIQPAPKAVEIAAPIPTRPDSLTRKMVDSTGKKTLKRILRTIGGAPAEQPRAKR